jgi:hypothetical protein
MRARPRARWLWLATAVLAVVASTLAVVAYTTWRGAEDTRAATRPLAARAARLDGDVRDADTVIDRLTWLSAALRSQDDATRAAVEAANQAATQYNTAQAGIAAAVAATSGATAVALQQTTSDVRRTVDDATSALSQLTAEPVIDGSTPTGDASG